MNSFTDQQDPVLTCPEDFIENSNPVSWEDLTVTDDIDNNVKVTCMPSSGTTFESGDTEVMCTATDDALNTGTCSFTVSLGKGFHESNI